MIKILTKEEILKLPIRADSAQDGAALNTLRASHEALRAERDTLNERIKDLCLQPFDTCIALEKERDELLAYLKDIAEADRARGRLFAADGIYQLLKKYEVKP